MWANLALSGLPGFWWREARHSLGVTGQKVTCSRPSFRGPTKKSATPHGNGSSSWLVRCWLLQPAQGRHNGTLVCRPFHPGLNNHARSHRNSQSRSDATHPRQALIPAASQALESVGPAGLLRLHEPVVVTLLCRIRMRVYHFTKRRHLRDSTPTKVAQHGVRYTGTKPLRRSAHCLPLRSGTWISVLEYYFAWLLSTYPSPGNSRYFKASANLIAVASIASRQPLSMNQ